MKEGFFACPAGGAFAALFFVGLALWAFLDLLVVWSGVGLLAFPCFVIGLLALPLCGAAPTFLCLPQRKVGKRKRLTPLAHKRVPRAATVVVHLESVTSRILRQ
ncbi:hypothetical protein ParKJ_01425 [Paraburkholderia fungorum]|uniref:Transmembrane protein n=1 Tax=Paraburkholderia fungorum TaxID=134537 RepID=A0AAP5UTL4_9BURK|nr:hypothetical protein [Paraburkholderia fungorum]MDT8836069.1 hypothetical protein [Paraburkholderia fungorum]